MKFNNLYVRGGVVIETIKPDSDPRSWSEREVRVAKEAVEGMSAALVRISPNRQILLDLLQYAE